MADKSITDLNVVPGSIDDINTWFAVAQSGAAYKVSGHEFILALTSILDGHGGIKTITYTDPVAPSLTGTMTITLADDTTTSVSIQNGKGITSIAKTGTVDLVDTYTITYNDSTTSTFTVTNGAKGDTGDSWYVWIRYAGSEPTQDSDMGTEPDNWMGIYSGTSSTAPVHYTDYDWFQIKGEKGDKGDPSTIVSQSVTYQEGTSPNIQPSGTWTTSIPTVAQGNYLWTRTIITFNSGSPVTFYSVARMGLDGTGSVTSVNNQSPDANGNVNVTASDVSTTDSTSVQAEINGVKNTLNQLTNRKIIMIGDSYGEQGSGLTFYWEHFRDSLGLTTGVNFWAAYGSGAGFGNNGYLTQIQSLAIADKESITDVFVCGGWNDSDLSQSYGSDAAFNSGVAAFKAYVEANYPNAKVTIAHISWGDPQTASIVYTQMPVSIKRYASLSSKGWRILSGIEYVLHRYDQDVWQADGTHPAQAGQDILGQYLPSAFLTGSCDVNYLDTGHTMAGTESGWTVSYVATRESFVNGTYEVGFASAITLQHSGQNIVTDGSIEYTMFGSDYIYGKGWYGKNNKSVLGRVWDGSYWYNANITIEMTNNLFTFTINVVKSNGTTDHEMNLKYIVIPPVSFNIPFSEC